MRHPAVCFSSVSRVPSSNGYLATLSTTNTQRADLLLGPCSVEWLESNSSASSESLIILQGSSKVLTTARIRPDVCDITQSQLLFAALQRSVIRLPALGFQKRSVGIKTQHSHPEYMQGWDKQQTCWTCHIVCHRILMRLGSLVGFGIIVTHFSSGISTSKPHSFNSCDLEHPKGLEICVFYRWELQQLQCWSRSDPVSGESSHSHWTNWPFSKSVPQPSPCPSSAVRPAIWACEILKTSTLT